MAPKGELQSAGAAAAYVREAKTERSVLEKSATEGEMIGLTDFSQCAGSAVKDQSISSHNSLHGQGKRAQTWRLPFGNSGSVKERLVFSPVMLARGVHDVGQANLKKVYNHISFV